MYIDVKYHFLKYLFVYPVYCLCNKHKICNYYVISKHMVYNRTGFCNE